MHGATGRLGEPKDAPRGRCDPDARGNFGGLPVLDGGQLVGVITDSDIFGAFARIACQVTGTRITLQRPEPAGDGEPLDAAGICAEAGYTLIGLSQYVRPAETAIVTLHVTTQEIEGLVDELARQGFVLIDVQKRDHAGSD